MRRTQKVEQAIMNIKEKGLAGKSTKERELEITRHLPCLYRHFKGNYYLALEIAYDCDNAEPKIIYQAIKDKKKWIRPLSSFASYVDTDKYPNADQPFRLCNPFQLLSLGYTFNDINEELDNLEICNEPLRIHLKTTLFRIYEMYKLKNKKEGSECNE